MEYLFYILIERSILGLINAFYAKKHGKSFRDYYLLSLCFSPGIMGIIMAISIKRNPSWQNMPETEAQKEEDSELSQKVTNKNFEKVLDTSEKQEGEDSISYLARCMREAEKEDNN